MPFFRGETERARLALAGVVLGTSAALGVAVTRGGRVDLMLVAFVIGTVGASMFAQLHSFPLFGWILLSGAAYAFVRVPRAHAVLTFDRIWLLTLLGALLLSLQQRETALASRRFAFALATFTVLFGLRAFATSTGRITAVETWLDAIVFPLVLFVATRRYVSTPGDARRVTGAMMLAGAILSSIGLAERVLGFQLATRSGGTLRFDQAVSAVRVSGPYPAPEPFVLSVVICLAAALYWANGSRGIQRLFALAIAVLDVTVVGLTLFRAGWIAGVLVVFCALAVRPRARFRLVFVSVVFLIGAVLVSALTPLEQSRTFVVRTQSRQSSANVYARLAAYQEGLDMFASHPLVGVGVGRYEATVPTFQPRFVHGVKALSYPHSTFNQLLAEQGAVGLASFVIVLLYGVGLIFSLGRRSTAPLDAALYAVVLGASAAYIVMSATLTMLPYAPPNDLLLVLFGCVAGRLDALERGVVA